jgi:hypothetical protein
MLNVWPTILGYGGHVEAVARGNEGRFVGRETRELAIAWKIRPLLRHALGRLRSPHAWRRKYVEECVAHGPKDSVVRRVRKSRQSETLPLGN